MNEELYEGREQTEVKHKILERYLSAFAPIVGNWAADIVYVDCLAGPWEARGANLEDTSFSRSINVLRGAKDLLAGRGKHPSFRCLLIEDKLESFNQLNDFAIRTKDIDVTAKQWDFSRYVDQIIGFVKERKGSFPFFFIDPTGWELLAIDLIKPILVQKPGEVLLNLMTSWIKRFLSDELKNFERLLGPEVGRLRQLAGDEQEEELVRRYAQSVKKAGAFDYVCTLPVLKAGADMFHFWMIYGTRHPKGVEVFKNTERVVIPFMHETRAKVQQKKNFVLSGGQMSLLSADETYYEQRLTRLRDKNRELARTELAAYLKTSKAARFDDAWARVMQFSLVTESDLKGWVEGWVKAGKLRIMNMRSSERVPKRKSGHVLKWIEG